MRRGGLTATDRLHLRWGYTVSWLGERNGLWWVPTFLGDMNRRDRTAWASAATWGDLGELVVAWLHGRIRQTPGHCAPPCDETIPLIPVLTLANRAGFVTDGSQFAADEWWGTCDAYVTGFAADDAALALSRAIEGTPLIMSACRGREHSGHGRGWRGCPSGHEFWQDACPHTADVIADAWYVTITDPEPGRNDRLWPALEKFASERAAA